MREDDGLVRVIVKKLGEEVWFAIYLDKGFNILGEGWFLGFWFVWKCGIGVIFWKGDMVIVIFYC